MHGSCLSVSSIAKTALRTGPALNKVAPGCYLNPFFLTTCHLTMICQVRVALDGRHIPKHLLNDTPNPPSLKIAYSQHTDLNVKFQSHRSRFGSLHAMPCPPPHPPALSFMPSSASACFWGFNCQMHAANWHHSMEVTFSSLAYPISDHYCTQLSSEQEIKALLLLTSPLCMQQGLLFACVQGLHKPISSRGPSACRPQHAGTGHSGATCHFRQPHGRQCSLVSGGMGSWTPDPSAVSCALSSCGSILQIAFERSDSGSCCCDLWLRLESVFLLQIENAMYPVNVEALNTVFSPYGFVQKIAIFEKNGQTQVGHALTHTRKPCMLSCLQSKSCLWGKLWDT